MVVLACRRPRTDSMGQVCAIYKQAGGLKPVLVLCTASLYLWHDYHYSVIDLHRVPSFEAFSGKDCAVSNFVAFHLLCC